MRDRSGGYLHLFLLHCLEMLSASTKRLGRHIVPALVRRQYATAPQSFHVFDRNVKRMQKDRAASNVEESRVVDYLKDEIAARVADRLLVTFSFFFFFFFFFSIAFLFDEGISRTEIRNVNNRISSVISIL
jgi:hypothetical protein